MTIQKILYIEFICSYLINLGQLMKILQLSASTLPLFISKPGEKIPPLVGCIPASPDYNAKPGDMVAALTKVADKGNDEENWVRRYG